MQNITDYKTFVLQYMSRDEVREIGNLRLKETWVVAAEYCKAYATAVEEVAEAAQQPAQDAAEAVCDVLYSDTSRSIVQWVAAAVLMVVFTIGLLVYRITTALWRYTAPRRQQLIRRRANWLTAQASYAALVLLLLKSA